jgi:hypothetical protein
VEQSAGRHTVDETVGVFANAATRHVECEDCHDVHESQAGTHTANSSAAGAALRGAWGIVPPAAAGNFATPTASGYTTTTVTGLSTNYEAYVCFKCHAGPGTSIASVTTSSTTYTRTDLGTEFNPNNFSFHNVTGQATAMRSSFTYLNSAGTSVTQPWPIPTTMFQTGYNSNSMITCTSCHTGSATQARGPHGSAQKWLLDPNYTVDWTTVTLANRNTANYLCRKCHNFANAMNDVHTNTNHSSRACNMCHISVPHGWKRPRLMGYTTDPGLYKTATGGVTRLRSTWAGTHTLTSGNVTGWLVTDCNAGCTGSHPTFTPYMP